MPSGSTVKVLIDDAMDPAKGKSWCKVLARVDPQGTDGHAFDGEWVTIGKRVFLEPGVMVLRYDETGSVKSRKQFAKILRVEWDGSLAVVEDAEGRLDVAGRDWAGLLAERVAPLLDATTDDPSKMYSCAFTAFEAPDGTVRAAFDGAVVGTWDDWKAAGDGLAEVLQARLAGS